MSYNNNGYAEPSRLLLGIGDLYINDQYVGNLKGSVTFSVTREMAYQRPGNLIADLKAQVTGEEVTLEAEICDLKIDQLRAAFGINQAVDSSSARNIRVRETIQLVGTTAVTLGRTAATNIVVTKLDRSKVYTLTTDYTIGANAITRVGGGTIGDGEYVLVEYTHSDSGARSIAMGGESKCPPTFRVDYTHQDCNGKYWQITVFRAVTTTEFELAFNERESGDYTIHNIMFRALVDLTKPEGQNLFEIVQEDAGA
jgi:hypothetical protein